MSTCLINCTLWFFWTIHSHNSSNMLSSISLQWCWFILILCLFWCNYFKRFNTYVTFSYHPYKFRRPSLNAPLIISCNDLCSFFDVLDLLLSDDDDILLFILSLIFFTCSLMFIPCLYQLNGYALACDKAVATDIVDTQQRDWKWNEKISIAFMSKTEWRIFN